MFKDIDYVHEQLDRLIFALEAFREGDISVRLSKERNDKFADLAEAYNTMVEMIGGVSTEVSRISRVGGIEGNLEARAEFKAASGVWKDLIDNINILIEAIAKPVLEVSRILNSIASGKLEDKFSLTVTGDFRAMADVINRTLGSLNVFAEQVTQVAREVGVEGKLGGQASVPNVSGTWKDLTDNVNQMASNLTAQVREIAGVTTAVANGDLSRKITEDGKGGEVLELSQTINTMVDSLNIFAAEVTNVAREVGIEGKLGGQADVPNVAGIWKALTDNVNTMASNLTLQVRDIANVATAVADGDLSQKISEEAKGGEVLELSRTINTMVDSLNVFAAEVTRVSREVGTEGKLGGQAVVPNVAGTWKGLTDNVNTMASNLTAQVREIANVTTAVAQGDLTQKISETGKGGEVLVLSNTINSMVDSLNIFAAEVTRVAREVGTEGKLGGQAKVPGVAGTWKDLTDNVNQMASNLTGQVREIANVATAVANGDLTQKISIEVRGEIAELKGTINQMVDSLNIFSDEVTRVAREVGTEGILGGQAEVPNVAGAWLELTDNVNTMASNLTTQVREIAKVTTAVANGDLSQKISEEAKGGEVLELSRTINTMVDSLNIFSDEVTRVAREVGTEGILGGQADVPDVAGTWKDLTDNVNFMAANLTAQVREIAGVATAVANGDLSRKIAIEARGEIAELKATINQMVDSLNIFAAEVTRVAREVGTEGILGGQAQVPNVAGTWKDLTDNVNTMGSNLTTQVREIATVTTAVANGDLSQKISIEAKGGEVLELSQTINRMVDALNIFAAEVTRVAREVGTEGILGGQAGVPNVAGSWKDLTDNVNLMASNLTSQVREIANVSTALARGDFSRKIEVEALGEVLELKNNINAMVDSFINIVRSANTIARGDFSVEMPLRSEADQLGIALNTMTDNLRRISEQNENEAWIKTGQAGLNDRMRGEQDLPTLSRNIISYLTRYIDAQVGVLYLTDTVKDEKILRLTGSYAFNKRKGLKTEFLFGESLVGQAALENDTIIVSMVPDDYIAISSGLGDTRPNNIIVQPFTLEGEVKGVVEIGSFHVFQDNQIELIRLVSENIAIAINSAQDREKMKELLSESQRQSEELMSQQEKLKTQSEELQAANEELEAKTKDLEQQKEEIQTSRYELENKARELELASRYKSEFLANMSHELRTPLNSLLILAKDLSKNERNNLTDEQVKDATVIYEGGLDLLNLINDILDLSKVEAGKMLIEPEETKISRVITNLKNQFEPMAKKKNLRFRLLKDKGVPDAMVTDSHRLEQIIKNLLSNAFKFTEKGEVSLRVHMAKPDVRFQIIDLPESKVVGFSVSDTGIGISENKRHMIFEAFQQAEGGTSRQYGGTGLGLTISRELARLLGGEIHLESVEGEGSTFTVYFPLEMDSTAGADGRENTVLPPPRKILTTREERHQQVNHSREAYLADDRDDLSDNDQSILIIEDDKQFARILQQTAKKAGYKTLVAREGTEGLILAEHCQPSGILLDIKLPDIDGLKVLDHLKFSLKTRHIPVHVMSVELESKKALQKGAVGFLSKPVSRDEIMTMITRLESVANKDVKDILVIEDDKANRQAVTKMLRNREINIESVANGKDALALIKKTAFDCVILDLKLPDMSGFDLLRQLQASEKGRHTPVVVYTGKELTRAEVSELQKYTESIVIKGASSPERLLDEVSLFLHSVESKFSAQQKRIMNVLHDPEQILKDRKVMLVDDDMRNTYALSKILSDAGMEVVMADNGELALERLKAEEGIELVIMDVMMPVMDGYEAIRRIRADKDHQHLPIIALTAKAMSEDKAKCIEAGANDYLTKPVDTEKLLDMMRVWLYPQKEL